MIRPRVERTDDGPVAVVRVDCPPVNPLSNAVLTDLIEAIVSLEAAPSIRAAVLTGTGTKAFLAGADLAEITEIRRSCAAVSHHVGLTRRLLDELTRSSVPVIAAVQAHALGGGLEVALACDLVVADEAAKLGCPEVRLGLIPGAGGTQRLTAALGRHRSAELILTGRAVSAAEAQAMGIVTEVAAAGTALERALALAHRIAALPGLAVQSAKRAIRAPELHALPAGLELERREFLAALASADAGEGIAAFLDKREAEFVHG